MSNSERDYESLVFRIEQVEQNQQVMARYIASAQLHQQLNVRIQVIQTLTRQGFQLWRLRLNC